MLPKTVRTQTPDGLTPKAIKSHEPVAGIEQLARATSPSMVTGKHVASLQYEDKEYIINITIPAIRGAIPGLSAYKFVLPAELITPYQKFVTHQDLNEEDARLILGPISRCIDDAVKTVLAPEVEEHHELRPAVKWKYIVEYKNDASGFKPVASGGDIIIPSLFISKDKTATPILLRADNRFFNLPPVLIEGDNVSVAETLETLPLKHKDSDSKKIRNYSVKPAKLLAATHANMRFALTYDNTEHLATWFDQFIIEKLLSLSVEQSSPILSNLLTAVESYITAVGDLPALGYAGAIKLLSTVIERIEHRQGSPKPGDTLSTMLRLSEFHDTLTLRRAVLTTFSQAEALRGGAASGGGGASAASSSSSASDPGPLAAKELLSPSADKALVSRQFADRPHTAQVFAPKPLMPSAAASSASHIANDTMPTSPYSAFAKQNTKQPPHP
jgi:hypothetical protein